MTRAKVKDEGGGLNNQRRFYATVDVPSGWTVETFYEHNKEMRKMDAKLLKERDRRYTAERRAETERLDAMERSNDKALGLLAEQQKEYKHASNEWRSTLNDIVQRQITRNEVEGSFNAVNSKLDITFNSMNQKIDRQHTELLTQITALQQVNVKDTGKDEGLEAAKRNTRYIIGLAVGLPSLILAVVAFIRLFG